VKEYTRIRDRADAEWNELEQICTRWALDGWEILAISDGSTFRAATLVRDIPKVEVITPAVSATSAKALEQLNELNNTIKEQASGKRTRR
jgi:1-aminocyclopropane-1-carboxylate deaminase/D-cysteine desulfhydrase-like pyridoxal-dependent ACC family enzyme